MHFYNSHVNKDVLALTSIDFSFTYFQLSFVLAYSKTWSGLVWSGLVWSGLISFGWSYFNGLVWSGLYGIFIGLVSIFLLFTIFFSNLYN